MVNRYPKCHIYIITSDRDYLQLNAHNVEIFNLTYKNQDKNVNRKEVSSWNIQPGLLKWDVAMQTD